VATRLSYSQRIENFFIFYLFLLRKSAPDRKLITDRAG
jgi:hypothetical protein